MSMLGDSIGDSIGGRRAAAGEAQEIEDGCYLDGAPMRDFAGPIDGLLTLFDAADERLTFADDTAETPATDDGETVEALADGVFNGEPVTGARTVEAYERQMVPYTEGVDPEFFVSEFDARKGLRVRGGNEGWSIRRENGQSDLLRGLDVVTHVVCATPVYPIDTTSGTGFVVNHNDSQQTDISTYGVTDDFQFNLRSTRSPADTMRSDQHGEAGINVAFLHVIEADYQNGDLTIWDHAGAEIYSAEDFWEGGIADEEMGRYALGRGEGTGWPLNGVIHHYRAYDRVIDSEEREEIIDAISDRYDPGDFLWLNEWQVVRRLGGDSARGVYQEGDTIWSCGQPRIHKSTDGGATWTEPDVPDPSGFDPQDDIMWDVQFDGVVGYIPTDNGFVFKSTDGGETWTAEEVGNDDFRALHVIDENNVWVAGGGGDAFVTSDGGANWTDKSPPTTNFQQDIFFHDSATGWTCGNNGDMHHTADGGENWTSQSVPTSTWIEGVGSANEHIVYCCDRNGNVHKSIDGGENWSQSMADGNDFRGIFVVDANKVYVTGTQGEVWYTTDGGDNWAQADTPTDTLYKGIHISEDRGVASGHGEEIVVNPAL